ncbi:hypothetical protein B484DRAFT_338717 [Ochromonadaceae sp. CCMP2298]|nr:hypothetical protein B484DRAFT_338717 [Ochromonadaceae sp. CCMP2298]
MLTVEDLPLSVSLSAACPPYEGRFPIVYVNKAFARSFGYFRAETLGKKCDFLHTSQSMKSEVDKINKALRCARPARVALTQARKDGLEFNTVMAMKPVFDRRGVYCFVISVFSNDTHANDKKPVHKDASSSSYKQNKDAYRQKQVLDVLSVLPNILK